MDEEFDIEIEIEQDADDGSDVTMGPRRRRWPVLAIVVVGVLVVASVTANVGSRDSRSSPTTATTIDSTPSTEPASQTPTGSSVQPTESVAPALPFGTKTGLVVYLTPSDGAPTSMLFYDVDTGTIHDVTLGQDVGWYIRAIDGAGGTIVDGGAVVVVSGGVVRPIDVSGTNGIADGPNGRVAPGPDGGAWVRGFNPAGIELVGIDGARTGLRYDLPAGAELYGSMADGRPVVRGADRNAFVVERDGARTALGVPDNPVELGNWVEVRCDATQTCGAVGHRADGTTVELGRAFDEHGMRISYRLSAHDDVAAGIGTDGLFVLDLRTRTTTTVVRDPGPSWFGGDDRVPARFLPDGRGLVVQTQRGLALADLSGHVLFETTLGLSQTAGLGLLGVGVARGWQHRSP